MSRLRRGALAVGLAIVLAGAPVVAGATLPPVGSTSPSDDVTVPVIPPGTSVADALGWLESALSVRMTELDSLVTTITTTAGLQAQVRAATLQIVTTASSGVAAIDADVTSLATLPEVHQSIAKTVQLHVFSVLEPQVNEILAAQTTRAAAIALLGQESSIRAAVAAAKTAKLSVGKAAAELSAFHNHLVLAKQLVGAIPTTLLTVGSLSVTRATTKLVNAATAETTAATLVAQAKSAEQSIVSTLASKLRASHRAV